ncbi:TetR/AcrR family transcriptional regulator [Hwanghaeella grinnelliae]|nr:TetR/AcrR family transcriptional regulator [Hwanghaeella grinnelliae]
MARPKTYNRQEAVVKACKAFWEHGYQALGVRELERLTGLNQFAIRTDFGGKEGLYLEAMRFYADAAIATAMPPLRAGGIPAIVAFLRNLVTVGSMTSSPWGCLVVNTGIENARVQSGRLTEAVAYYWDALETHFKLALEIAQDSGDLPNDVEIDGLAKGLVAGVMGVHATNRSENSNTAGTDLVEILCGHLTLLRAS